jgi:hypothetical protein
MCIPIADSRALHDELCRRLREIGVEHQTWPGRDDGFAALLFNGRDLGHFHHWSEIDLRLGKMLIAKEKLVPMKDSKVHPDRAKNSPWHEMRLRSVSDVDEAVRLVQLAITEQKG